ncbi:hypothetical protein IV102_28390 [bacterium]|nr:hypothetical protein [bacterium]
MSQSATETSQEHRHGLLHCDLDALWASLSPEQIEPWHGQISNWTGKSDELRRNLPLLEVLAQFREADLEPLRTLALELRANSDDIVFVGSSQMLDLARLQELFDGPGGRGPRLHLPRSKAWEHQLLPALEAVGSRVSVVILGWSPGELLWERGVPPALAWMKGRYSEAELHRRVVGLSSRSMGQLLQYPMRHVNVVERAFLAPIYSGFGLFPLYLAGFEASSLIEGARSQVRALEKSWSLDNATLRYAVLRQILTMQEGWVEAVVTPDSFLEPLGLWCLRLLETSCQHLDPPIPYPFPHLQCQEHDSHPAERPHYYELQLDYASPGLDSSLMDRGRPRCWLGMPRLDMYTLGGCISHLATSVALNHRWSEIESPPVETE